MGTQPNPRIFLSAGEASGDHYGAQIIAALKASLPDAEFFGLGGAEMTAAGLDAVVRSESVAHMGITEVIAHAPGIYAKYRRLIRAIRVRRPSIAVLIDFPDVNFRLARELKRLNIPVVYFVSPQLWAWKRSRLRWVQQRVAKMLVIFPFEEPFYKNRNVDAEFVGHPLAEMPLPTVSREDYASRYNLDPDKPWIALLPGSRWREVESNLPTMVEMASRFPLDCEYILPVASTIDRERLTNFTAGWIAHFPGTNPTIPQPYIHLVDDARDALRHARGSIVASGTATVQAAVIGNPFVVVYRVSDLTYKLAKYLVRYPAEISAEPDSTTGDLPVAMVNLIAGKRIVPELLQGQFTAPNTAATLQSLLEDGPPRSEQIAALTEVRRTLLNQPSASERGMTAIERVRDTVLTFLG